jgi:hypothetical protein
MRTRERMRKIYILRERDREREREKEKDRNIYREIKGREKAPGPTKAQAREDNRGRAMHETMLSNDTLGNYVGLAR